MDFSTTLVNSMKHILCGFTTAFAHAMLQKSFHITHFHYLPIKKSQLANY